MANYFKNFYALKNSNTFSKSFMGLPNLNTVEALYN